MKERGFTLIELLIVITIIGVLAVAVLSAINPVEQIRKANDSRRKSDIAELLNSLERYYATFQIFPWTGAIPSGMCPYLGVGSVGCTSGVGTDVSELITKFELKEAFKQRKLNEYYVSGNDLDGDTFADEAHVCFKPESVTFTAQAAKNSTGGTSGTTGYICVPE